MKAFFSFSIILLLVSGVQAQRLGTCPIFPSNNPWNVRVDTMPLDSAHSATYIASVGGTIHVHPDFGSDTNYGIPWVAVSSSQPFVAVNDSEGYSDQSDPGPMPVPLNAPIEHDGDSHVLVVDTSNFHLYELYQGAPEQANHGWSATSTAIFALDSNNYRPDGWTSCDAAGLPIFPGLVRLDECKAGAINHALRFTVPHTQKAWIFPARHQAGFTTDTTFMPMGTRLRLKANFDDSKDTGYAKVITTALKKYGIILADNGSSWYISGETNPNWPDDDISQLKKITGNDFEVVSTGYPIETSSKMYPTPVIPLPNRNEPPALMVAGIVRDTARVGNSNAVQIPIQNVGGGTLTITRYYLKYGTEFEIADSNFHAIEPTDNAFVNINFSPVLHGTAVDTLFITTGSSVTALALVGFGTTGIFHISENPLNFGTVLVGASDTQFVVVNNIGDGELDLIANSTVGTNPDFSFLGIGPQPGPMVILSPGDSEYGFITFAPTALGPDTSLFELGYSDTTNGQGDTVLVFYGVGSASDEVAPMATARVSIAVYPNPASSVATVSIAGTIGPVHLTIVDPLGRTVWDESISSTAKLDMSTIPNGCYVLRAAGENGTVTMVLRVLH